MTIIKVIETDTTKIPIYGKIIKMSNKEVAVVMENGIDIMTEKTSIIDMANVMKDEAMIINVMIV